MKQKNNSKKYVIIMAVFICLSMIVSIFAVVLDNPENNLSYGKYNFKVTDNGYKTKIDGKYYDFQYFPSELESINMSASTRDTIKNSQMVIIVFDPDSGQDNLIYTDFTRFDLVAQLGKPVGFGVTNMSSQYAFNLLDCNNASKPVPIILINISSVPSIYESGDGCIIMNARLKDIVAAKDRLLYSVLGVMD